jgi:hypothetical protein
MLAAIHRSSSPQKLASAALPGWRVHQLTGNRAGHWSLTVTGKLASHRALRKMVTPAIST